MSSQDKCYYVLAFYRIAPLQNPEEEVFLHKNFIENRDIQCRLYLSKDGLNGQMSASKEDAEAYMAWLKSRPPFEDLVFKIHYWHEHVFPKKIVKLKSQLVALDTPVDFSKAGVHIAPKQFREMLENEKDVLLLDVRNDYEWDVGHFEGAERPPCVTFRDFNAYAEKIEKEHPEKPKVMMYCTGGIRCELYSAILKEKGFDDVFQLDGGIINYGLEEGNAHWKGKLFVFDDRMTVPIAEESETETCGRCHKCNHKAESYYNCANMECNLLYISCPTCLDQLKGCCSQKCGEGEKLRPYHEQNPHKPFKKSYEYFGFKKNPHGQGKNKRKAKKNPVNHS